MLDAGRGLKKEIKGNPVDQVPVGKREILDGVAARAVNHDGDNVLARKQLGGKKQGSEVLVWPIAYRETVGECCPASVWFSRR